MLNAPPPPVPIGTVKGRQPNTEALCHPPPPPWQGVWVATTTMISVRR